MQVFYHYFPTRVVFGDGALNQLFYQKLPGQKALIVIAADGSMQKHGYLQRVEKQLELAGLSFAVYDGVMPNPVLSNVCEGAEMARREKCDFVLGLGGGSSMDTAKATAVMATNPGDYWDYNQGITGKGQPLPFEPLPIVCVATTAGSGAEITPYAVITKEQTFEKTSFGNEDTYPTLSIIDPELMTTVSPLQTVCQGFDALFHAVESSLNKFNTPIGLMCVLQAVDYLAEYLPRLVSNGSDLEARGKVALAGTLAGSVMLCTSAHALEHALSAYHHEVPHGAGLIMLSVAYYKRFAESEKCQKVLIDLARRLGCNQASCGLDFVQALKDFEERCGVDKFSMRDYGISRDLIPAYVKNARQAMGGLFLGDPEVLSDDDCQNIFEESYE